MNPTWGEGGRLGNASDCRRGGGIDRKWKTRESIRFESNPATSGPSKIVHQFCQWTADANTPSRCPHPTLTVVQQLTDRRVPGDALLTTDEKGLDAGTELPVSDISRGG